MKAKLLIAGILFLTIALPQSFAQRSVTNKAIDPFFTEVNPQQIDFSQDYWNFITNNIPSKNQLQQYLSYDCSSIWTAPNSHNADETPRQNGIIGSDYQRIQMYISEVSQSKDNPAVYFIKGKSKVKNNICDFSGEIELLKLYRYEMADTEVSNCVYLVGKYILYEDSTQKYSGFYKGTTSCAAYIDTAHRKIKLDDTSGSVWYNNRNFVGTWTSYATNASKKCIWGDFVLPYTADLFCGDGDMKIRDKYVKNGWESFNDGSEYIENAKGKLELKDKWWLRKTKP